jgi:indole-3-glycerol phosphate synthase
MPEGPEQPGASPLPAMLAEIVSHKREEVAARKKRQGVAEFKDRIAELGRPRNFFGALVNRRSQSGTVVIAEIKRRSPSAGWLRPEYENGSFDPAAIARQYHGAGASAISCLTDERFFGGRLEFIHAIRDAVPLPVLRKDFILDPWQVWESRAAGADAVLLIAECLSQSELVDLSILARELQLTTLVECHDMENLFRVLPHVGFPDRSYGLLGINNRDLTTMRVDLNHSTRLSAMVEDTSILVSESGISTPEDLEKLRRAGVRIVLVGEALMRETSPGDALRRLLGPARGGA